jgi:hypothetical protein
MEASNRVGVGSLAGVSLRAIVERLRAPMLRKTVEEPEAARLIVMNGADEAASKLKALRDDQIVRCFILESGSPLIGNDTSSVVIELSDCVLVLGEIGLQAALPAPTIAGLLEGKRLFRAFASRPPIQWTNSFLRIIPGFTIKSGVYSKLSLASAMSAWNLSAVENGSEI